MTRFVILLLALFHSAVAVGQTLAPILARIDSLIIEAKYDESLILIDQQASTSTGQDLITILNKKSEVLLAQGKLADAQAIIEKVGALDPKSAVSRAVLLTNQGSYQMNLGRFDLAIERLSEAYRLFQQEPDTHAPEFARCVGLMSITYLATGKYRLAEENALVALQLRRSHYGENHEAVAASYNDLGLVYSSTDKDKALEYYEKALETYTMLHGDTHAKIAIADTNIGILYRQIELYGDAVNNLESALKIWKSIYPDGHPNEAFVQRNLGQTYFDMGNTSTALKYFEQALQEYRRFYGEKHPEISSTLNQIGITKLQSQNYYGALNDFQSAICANVPGFNDRRIESNPPISEYYNGIVLLYSLRLKAQGLEDLHFGKTLKTSDLKLSQRTLYLCDSLIDDIRHQSTDEADKISLGALASEVYEDGVRINTALADISLKPRSFREAAYYFAEKSKSAVLQESIADTQAKSFAGIPSDLVDHEKDLKSSISLLSQRLSQKPSGEEEQYLRETLVGLKHEYTTFTQRLEKEYPNYYDLKFNVASPGVMELQQLLKDDEAIISYFIATRAQRLYQFILTRKSFTTTHVPLPKDFERSTRGFNNGIYYRDFQTYKKASAVLYKTLGVRVPRRIKELIIVPAGRLGTLPFEALAMNAGKANDFRSTRFLIDRFAVSYEFSTGLIAQKSKAVSLKPLSILLCAPVTFPPDDELDALPATEQEVKNIGSLFADNTKKLITHQDANESVVKSDTLAQYNILHFATHGIVDEVDPEKSRIFLNENGGEDGDLFASEIYNLSMNADLAVLSACQTGLGKYSEGEGVIGLSRALVYAGARNLIVSFWSVADESTAKLMTDFYGVLVGSDEKSFRTSLRQAKVNMIRQGEFADPYYWAPFVLIGF